jgi:hypothetical protein
MVRKSLLLFLCVGMAVLSVPVQTQAAPPRVGDVVWAQWRPNAWFHGKVDKVVPVGLHVTFDDGDQADLAVSLITVDVAPKQEQVKVGTRVLATRAGKPFPGAVSAIAGGKYTIQFDDAMTETVALADLRLLAVNLVADRTAKVGDVVWAQWRPNSWHHGMADKKTPLGLHVTFDDGDKSDLPLCHIIVDRAPKKEDVKVGSRVLAKFIGGRFFPGTVTEVTADGQYAILFDDTDKLTVGLADLRLLNE